MGRGFVYTPQKTRDAEKELGLLIRNVGTLSGVPSDRPIVLTLIFGLPRLKSQRGIHPIAHAKRPDIDNFLKLVMDTGNGILWKDDGQVYDVSMKKLYVMEPHILIRVEEECG